DTGQQDDEVEFMAKQRVDECERLGVGVERDFAKGGRGQRLPAVVGHQRSHLAAAPALQREDPQPVERRGYHGGLTVTTKALRQPRRPRSNLIYFVGSVHGAKRPSW